MTVQGSILPLESSARIPAWQTVFWQLLELLGPRGYRGLQTVAPISSYRGIVGGIWCSHLPKLPGGVNNKPQNASQGFAARVTRSVFKKERKVVWATLGLCHLPLHKVILGMCQEDSSASCRQPRVWMRRSWSSVISGLLERQRSRMTAP